MKFGVATLAVSALAFAFAGTASACSDCYDLGEENNAVYITVVNSGTIQNSTAASASTGGNYAGGSYGGEGGEAGDGGNGGDAEVYGGGFEWCGECGSGSDSAAAGGNGGTGGSAHGGNAGAGGYVETGDAIAEAGSANELNNTDVVVEGCGCEEDNNECSCIPPWFQRDVNNTVTITVANSGAVVNATAAGASTGDNKAKGSYGGEGGEAGNGGDGGEATVGDDEGCGCDEWIPAGGGDAVGGDAGQGGSADGGEGGLGGTVRTGDTRSESGSINVMNTTMVRVTR